MSRTGDSSEHHQQYTVLAHNLIRWTSILGNVRVDDQLVVARTTRTRLVAEGCFQNQSDHGATKAVYGTDPDGNTFEITWILPRDEWGAWETDAPIKTPMDLDLELAHRG